MLRISDSIYIAFVFFFFFFNDTATTEIYTLPLHDALPIYSVVRTLLANGTTTAMYFGTIHAVGNQVLAERCLALGQRAWWARWRWTSRRNAPRTTRTAAPPKALPRRHASSTGCASIRTTRSSACCR